ncbi:MAG: hypothetical protein GY778_05105, partial [bacterium]|nr:hypothetical protein [bacterium]
LLPILLIVVPLVSYVIWLKMSQQNKILRAEGKLPHWRDAPWTLIVLITLGWVIVLLVVMALLGGSSIEGTYTPPSYVDGEVVPGKVTE